MNEKILRMTARYVAFAARHLKLSLFIILALTTAAGFMASGLKLHSDLKELLPPNYKSVKELDRVLDRVGGVGSLIAVVQSPDLDANKRFMDDLAKRINELPDGLIRYYDYRSSGIRKFYEDHFLYYIDTADLELFHERLKRLVDYEKFKRTPFFFDLDEEEGDRSGISFDDIRERAVSRYSAPIATVDDYFGGEWGEILIMVIRPYGANITIDKARALVTQMEEVVHGMDPDSYYPGMKVEFCGNVKTTIEEYDTLKKDIFSTAFLCVALVSAVIALYFLRIRIVFLLGTSLVAAIAMTFALTRLVIGYLNSQTAFLGSIIVGTGINYGIIVMARYIEERRRGKPPADAMQYALCMTISPTFLAMATTVVAFAILLIARIRGLSQFGFIGAVGVFLCWLSAVFVLPVLTLASERVWRIVKPKAVPRRKSALFEIISRLAVRSPVFTLSASFVALVVSLIIVVRFAPNAIEYDFTKMRSEISVKSGTEALENRVSKLFRSSMTPSVILVDSPEEGIEVCRAVERQNNALPPEARRVGSCHSIIDLLPAGQDKKLPIIEKVGALVEGSWTKGIKGKLKTNVEKIRRSVLGRPLNVDDLPPELTRHFEDKDGNRGAIVFVNPRPGMLLSDGRNLIQFAKTIESVDLGGGREARAASSSIIFADLINIIKKEAPYLTFASLFGVILCVALLLRRMRLSAIIIIGLVWGVVVMLGVLAWMTIRINFFNFIVLPLTFGIGVDYALNVAMRIRQEGPTGVAHAIRHTGGAVVLCSATTIIGYFVLTTANNKALATFGTAAVVGEITCLTAAILIVPAMIVFVDRWRKVM